MLEPILIVDNSCPISLTDDTNYSLIGTSWKFKPVSLTDDISGSDLLTIVSVLTLEFQLVISVTASVQTGEIVDPVTFYNSIIEELNKNTEGFYAELNTNGNDNPVNYRNWEINFYATGDQYNGLNIDVPRTLNNNPFSSSESSYIEDGKAIEFRNLSLYDPCNNEIDLGAEKQVSKYTLDRAYLDNEDFISVQVCDSVVVYENTKDANPLSCVLDALVVKINESTEIYINNYIVASTDGVSLILTAKISGVGFDAIVKYFDASVPSTITILETVVQLNVSSLELPTSENKITYIPQENGGTYKAVLTVLQMVDGECFYFTCEEYFSNWCFQLTSLKQCLIDMVRKVACSCPDNQMILDTSSLRNKIQAIDLMIETGYRFEDIDLVINSANSICGKNNCNTTTTVSSETDCGCK